MNQRLQQFLSAENISQSQFADKIGVARASVSHILAGRNRPGFDFIESMSHHYPSLNLEWLITGKGRMYKTGTESRPDSLFIEESPAEDSLFTQAEEPIEEEKPVFEPVQEFRTEYRQSPYMAPKKPQNAYQKPNNPLPQNRGIAKIIVFFADGTYQELK